ISYNCWLLGSDHFLATQFVYDYVEARKSVAEHLGTEIADPEISFRWSAGGDNALGTLMRYVQESVAWMEGLLLREIESLARAPSDLPHFAGDAYRSFPFRHTSLWADCDRKELADYVQNYKSISKQLAQSSLSAVRNGLDHKRDRDSFPSADSLL